MAACGPSVGTSRQGDGASSGTVEGTSSSGELPSDPSSGGEPELEGPGCGPPPLCERGTFEGHARIESEADLVRFEGYTAVTGMLEVLRSQDLVCLDRLACLETVGRSVRIQENTALRSTTGLRNVGSIGEQDDRGMAYVYVGENAVLESLDGFAASDAGVTLALWRNAMLREVSAFDGFGGVNQFVALENPLLERLVVAPREWSTTCTVNHNPHLCGGALQPLCGEPTPEVPVLHGASCPEGPPAPLYDWSPDLECSLALEDCPADETCSLSLRPNSTACLPVQNAPEVGQSCSYVEEGHAPFGNCGRYGVCWNGVCAQVPVGGSDVFICPDETASPYVGSRAAFVACLPSCDPLGECPDGEHCAFDDNRFTCTPTIGERVLGAGDSCGGEGQCGVGLACIGSDALRSCELGGWGCCTPYCDVREPDCPTGTQCVSWWPEDGARPLPVVEHVGVCMDP